MHGILGQDTAVRQLLGALAHDKLHHAMVFHGPPGVGKFTTALALAQIILCPTPRPRKGDNGAMEACGRCQSCKLTTTDSHPDLHVIRKELANVIIRDADQGERTKRGPKLRNIPIDVLRQHLVGGVIDGQKYVEAPVSKTAQLGHRKVFIIDEAELIDPIGQNALLKTLEEPPAGTYILLVTAAPQRLLPTIRSRCQPIAFGALPPQVVQTWLTQHAKEVDSPPSSRDLDWITRFAQGSLGRAQLALQYNLTEWGATLEPALASALRAKLPADFGATLAEKIDALAQAWVDTHDNASKEAANHLAAGLLLSYLADWARTRLAACAAEVASLDIDDQDSALAPWTDAIDLLTQSQTDLASNVNLGLVCDHLALRWSRTLTK
ncbi:MAG: DNA polymerase III subunit [Phycisphaeraceae bacterium]|nr:DNA polymerase III subunit [Phycisphaeraceae bacterium]